MAETIKVGIIGAGPPGAAHARGYLAAGGYKLAAVADLIPERRAKLMAEFSIPREFANADDLLADPQIAAVSVCLPNYLHLPIVLKAIKAGKHVVCESPPALSAKEARKIQEKIQRSKNKPVILFALHRRFGGHEQAAKQAIIKGYAGDVFHVRASWTRTHAIPSGTGWYTDRSKSGGGVMMDLGLHMLDLGWSLLGEPALQSVLAVAHQRFKPESTDSQSQSPEAIYDVEDSATALLKFAGNKTLEVSAAWALNQPPQQNGAICRVYGDNAAIEVYTPQGATLFRDFQPTGQAKSTTLKPPKITHYIALMRHFRQCIIAGTTPEIGAPQATNLMQMIDAIYKSIATGKSVGGK